MGIVVYNPQALKVIFCLLSAKEDLNWKFMILFYYPLSIHINVSTGGITL